VSGEVADWLDSHCHVTADRFDEDREAVLVRAREAGVRQLLAIGAGYGLDGNDDAVALARRDPGVFATAGIHPHDARELDDSARERLRAWWAEPRVVAVGECGLDYHYMNSPREAQREAFAWQVAEARALGRPVTIHVRDDGPDAYEELLDLWRAEGRGDVRGVLHCYTGTTEFALRALDHGLDVSFSGIVTFKKSHALRETARAVPLERLLVETDAPFLAPEGHRGRRNEPAWVVGVGEVLATLHGVAPAELARTTAANARRLFGLPVPGTEAP